jgi:hypothetical protein
VTSLRQEDESISSLENACCFFSSGRGLEACTMCWGRYWRCRSVTVLPAWSTSPCGWIFRSGVPPRPTAGCVSVGNAVGKFVACVWTTWCLWNCWDCLVTNIEIVLGWTRTILSTVEGRTRQQPNSAPSRSAL